MGTLEIIVGPLHHAVELREVYPGCTAYIRRLPNQLNAIILDQNEIFSTMADKLTVDTPWSRYRDRAKASTALYRSKRTPEQREADNAKRRAARTKEKAEKQNARRRVENLTVEARNKRNTSLLKHNKTEQQRELAKQANARRRQVYKDKAGSSKAIEDKEKKRVRAAERRRLFHPDYVPPSDEEEPNVEPPTNVTLTVVSYDVSSTLHFTKLLLKPFDDYFWQSDA